MASDQTTVNLTITLPDDLARSVQNAIDTGEYADSNEIIRDALGAWFETRPPILQDPDRLRTLWHEGLASGPGRATSADEIIAEARRRRAG